VKQGVKPDPFEMYGIAVLFTAGFGWLVSAELIRFLSTFNEL